MDVGHEEEHTLIRYKGEILETAEEYIGRVIRREGKEDHELFNIAQYQICNSILGKGWWITVSTLLYRSEC